MSDLTADSDQCLSLESNTPLIWSSDLHRSAGRALEPCFRDPVLQAHLRLAGQLTWPCLNQPVPPAMLEAHSPAPAPELWLSFRPELDE
jgi:hypothetical protein